MRYQLFFNIPINGRKPIIANRMHTARILQVIAITESIIALLLKIQIDFDS